MIRHLLALVLIGAGGANSATYAISIDQITLGQTNSILNPVNTGKWPQAGDRFVVVDAASCVLETGPVIRAGTAAIRPEYPFRGCKQESMRVFTYEQNDCFGESECTPPANNCKYKVGVELPSTFYQSYNVRQYGNYGLVQLSDAPSGGSTNALEVVNSWTTFPHTFACGSWGGDNSNTGTLYIWVSLDPSDTTDQCQYATDKSCQSCAWPYLALKDTIGCGCRIDKSKYQSVETLDDLPYAYCNTYSDGTSSQYYLDRSRSNFDASKGEVYAACSSPPDKTVYMPVGTCPVGSRADTSITNDSTAQDATGTIGKPPPGTSGGGGGIGSDTATHNRLDSILSYLRDTTGLGDLWQEPNLEGIGESLQVASAPVSAKIDSLGISQNASSGPWVATEPWPDTIHFTYDNPILGTIDTTLIVPWVIPGIPFDLWATIRWIEWVFVTLGMIPLMVRIAGGNEDA